MPPEPEPSRFSDWSSMGSPPTRTSPQNVPGVQTEPSDNAPNQLNVSNTNGIRPERIETSNSAGVNIATHTEQSREDQNIPVIVRPAPLNVEVGTQRNSIESNKENANDVPTSQIGSARPSPQTDDVLLIRDVP